MHPSEELLLTFATGQADLPHRVLIEGHLDGCATCRSVVAEVSIPGGALLTALPAEPLPDRLWNNLRAQVEALPAPASVAPSLAEIPLPPGARQELPPRPAVHWWRLPTGAARIATLTQDPQTGSVLLAGYMPAGQTFPRHLHVGPEDVLVLTGGYADQFGTFETGAYTSYAPGSEHQPATDLDEGCWSLVRLEQPNKFYGWRGWLQHLLE